jgi:ABC-type nickel/cobalt efflux system permease component RcnA
MTQQEMNMLMIGAVLFLIVVGIVLLIGYLTPQGEQHHMKKQPVKPHENPTKKPDTNKVDTNKPTDVNESISEKEIEKTETEVDLNDLEEDINLAETIE